MSTRATYIRIRNWDRYQHYSDRRPPWIKLHVELLDKHDTMSLPAATFKLAIVLLLDAARTSNVIPSNIERLAADAYLTREQTKRGLSELLSLRFVEPLGKRKAEKQLASNGLAESYPSRARTRSASVSEGLTSEEPQTQELMAHFCERVTKNGDKLPSRVRGQTASEIKRLVNEGIEPRHIRRAVELLADKGKHPSILPSLVLEAQRENGNGRVDIAAIAAEMFGEGAMH